MTIIDLIDHCAARLEANGLAFGHGTNNAFDEACWLVLWRLGLPLDDLDGVATQVPSVQSQGEVEALIELRINSRKPAAYLTQEAWLQGLPFYIDERSIVPRSLIAEVLAQGLIDPWLRADASQALDLCTGNASLAVLLAKSYPQLMVDGSDISGDALEVAAINVRRHDLGSRVRLIECDGLPPEAMRPAQGYDLIVCNPPYVNQDGMAGLPAEFKMEPAIALAGGLDGMDFIRPLLACVASAMAQDGLLILEIGHERENFERVFPRLSPLWLATSAGEDSVLMVEREALQT